MKKLLLAIAVGVLLAPMAAGARDSSFFPLLQAAQGDYKKGQGQDPRGGQDRRGGQRDAVPPRDGRNQGQGRMTDEERRELHRDIDRANREIYRPKGRW